jgi:hydroxymethylbilane synthase
MMKTRIVIGSRGSKLALIQAASVAEQLRRFEPNLEIEIRKIVTEGDRNQAINIEEAGDIGIFVKALEEALIKGEIDLAVHSLKDLPVIQPAELVLVAVAEREDPRDALVAGSNLADMKPGARIGTSSIRRSVQLKRLRKDIETVGIRGNVDTRLRKVANGDVDGIIVAAAAMLRLGREKEITEFLPSDKFVPAAGQGALALEVRQGDDAIKELAGRINHFPTWQAVAAERAFLSTLGGGCSVPISANAIVEGGRLNITGMISDRMGKTIYLDTIEDDTSEAKAVGIRLAHKMLKSGADKVVAEMRRR